jgi:hypothetical protein
VSLCPREGMSCTPLSYSMAIRLECITFEPGGVLHMFMWRNGIQLPWVQKQWQRFWRGMNPRSVYPIVSVLRISSRAISPDMPFRAVYIREITESLTPSLWSLSLIVCAVRHRVYGHGFNIAEALHLV